MKDACQCSVNILQTIDKGDRYAEKYRWVHRSTWYRWAGLAHLFEGTRDGNFFLTIRSNFSTLSFLEIIRERRSPASGDWERPPPQNSSIRTATVML